MRARILVGDCRESMRTLPDASVDSVVCDPPYHLTSIVQRFGKEDASPAKSDGPTGVYARASRGFMGQTWDGGDVAFRVETWREVLRVLKPGGYMLAFSGTRTYHRMTVAIEDAGFEIRDCLMWIYGSGFPKSLNIGGGWGTALKPAWEPIVLARKPLSGTVAANVERYGTGAINVDGCRVECAAGDEVSRHGRKATDNGWDARWSNEQTKGQTEGQALGRWPANVLLSHDPACGDACAPGCPCAMLDDQSGESVSPSKVTRGAANPEHIFGTRKTQQVYPCHGDKGGASRYFNQLPITRDDFPPFIYTAKAGRSDREEGAEHLTPRTGAQAVGREEGSAGTNSPRAGASRTAGEVRNIHPTVKPTELMRHLCRLVTPPGGTVLDPFMGSGSTGRGAMLEGFRFIGCELSPEYAEIALGRIRYTLGPLFAGEADYG